MAPSINPLVEVSVVDVHALIEYYQRVIDTIVGELAKAEESEMIDRYQMALENNQARQAKWIELLDEHWPQ